MGAYTFAAFETRIREITGVLDTTLLPQAEIFRRLNEEYQNVLAARARSAGKEIPELSAGVYVNTTAGRGYVDIAAYTPSKIDGVTYGEYPLEMISQGDFNIMGGANISGTPSHWFISHSPSIIYLFPVPDSTYSLLIDYTKIPTAITSSGTPTTGQVWDDVIMWGAIRKLASALKDWDLYKGASDVYQDSLGIALSTLPNSSEMQYHVSAGYAYGEQ